MINSDIIFKIIFNIVVEFVNFLPKNSTLEELSTNELYLFLFVCFNKPTTMKNCSNKLQLSKSSITLLTDKLENKGLIKRIRSSEDRRKIYLTTTNKGEEIFSNFSKNFKNLAHNIEGKFTNEELKIINKGFEIFLKKLGVKLWF